VQVKKQVTHFYDHSGGHFQILPIDHHFMGAKVLRNLNFTLYKQKIYAIK